MVVRCAVPSDGTATGREGRHVAAAAPCSTTATLVTMLFAEAAIATISRRGEGVAAPPYPGAMVWNSGAGWTRSRNHGLSSGTLTVLDGRAVESASSHS